MLTWWFSYMDTKGRTICPGHLLNYANDFALCQFTYEINDFPNFSNNLSFIRDVSGSLSFESWFVIMCRMFVYFFPVWSFFWIFTNHQDRFRNLVRNYNQQKLVMVISHWQLYTKLLGSFFVHKESDVSRLSKIMSSFLFIRLIFPISSAAGLSFLLV